MAKLIIKYNDDVVDHVELRQGDMKIGRKPGCDIFLDNLAVSGEHANIFTIGDDSFIQDMNSTNGTYINNKRVTKHHLRSGETITIGKHALVYLNEQARAEAAPDGSDYAKTVVITPPANPPAAAPAAKPAGIERQATLYVLNGVNRGKRIDLTKSVTNLGKTGRHAGTIAQKDGGYMLAGVDDTDKPKLNGRVIPETGAKLRNGDIIEVAGTRLQFYLK